MAPLLIELGSAIVGLAILARLASRWGFSAIPLYLLGGLAFGNGGLLPLGLSEGFIHIGAEIGVLLLLFLIGLEYDGGQLAANLTKGLPAGALDFMLNFFPGFAAGLLMKWAVLPAILLGGVTWITSSGIVAKLLADQGRAEDLEIPIILSVLVLEDLAMAVYLPVVAALMLRGDTEAAAISVAIALAAVGLVLFIALRYGPAISAWTAHESDEVVLLTTFGAVLLVAGVAQQLRVSSAVGAFLAGVALSGPIAHRAHRLLAPLRDLFAATFFLFFGLQIAPHSLPAVAGIAVLLGVITAATKVATGYLAARRAGINARGGMRAGLLLVSRGEFSIVIAGLGASVETQLGPLAAAYVLFLAVLGPLLARLAR